MIRIAAELMAARGADDSVLLVAQSNAGLPQVQGDAFAYTVDPPAMGAHAQELREAGIDLIGACCGSSPEHIRAIATALN